MQEPRACYGRQVPDPRVGNVAFEGHLKDMSLNVERIYFGDLDSQQQLLHRPSRAQSCHFT